MKTTPFIQYLNGEDQIRQAVFGIRLVSIPAFDNCSGKASQTTLQEYSDLLNQFYLPDQSITFSLRTIFFPDQTAGTLNTVEVVLFVILSDKSIRKLKQKTGQIFHQIQVILSSSFPFHEFEFITTETEFQQFYSPAFLEEAHFCEIRKRESAIQLNSIANEKPIGFLNSSIAITEAGSENQVYFPHPFYPRQDDFERLYRLLILNDTPFIVNFCLTPTQLQASEESALISEIAKGEGFKPEDEVPIRQVYLERARLVRQGLVDQLLRLQDAPFYCQIILASGEPIGRGIAESIGSSISQSIGSGSNQEFLDLRIQMGGYDILFPATSGEQADAKHDFMFPGKATWGKTIAVEGLKRFRFLVDGYQGTCGFRFPSARNNGLVEFRTHQTKMLTPPREMSELSNQNGTQRKIIGVNNAFGFQNPIYLTDKDLRQHVYIVGQTGTGKTTLLKSMILGDIANDKGVAVIDPHGDLFNELLDFIPKQRVKDVVLVDPLDMEFPVGFNLLACSDLSQRIFIAREIKAIMHRLLHDTFGDVSNNYIGPVFYKHVQMDLLLAMSDPDNPGTLLEFYEIFQHTDYWKRWLPLKWNDPMLEDWVEEVLPNMDYTYRTRTDNTSMGEYVGSKFDEFILDPRLQLIFGQKESTINLGSIMDSGKILLINLAKGLLGEATSQFLGLILMAKFQSEIMARGRKAMGDRRQFTIYVDEFQSLATENFSLLLSEARKFGVSLVLANQFVSQIKDQRILEAVFGNVGTMLSFRVGKNDAARLESQFSPQFTQFDLANLPNWHACVKTTLNGQVVPPFNLQTIQPRVQTDEGVREAVIVHARKTYGRPRTEVEQTIRESLKSPMTENGEGEAREIDLFT